MFIFTVFAPGDSCSSSSITTSRVASLSVSFKVPFRVSPASSIYVMVLFPFRDGDSPLGNSNVKWLIPPPIICFIYDRLDICDGNRYVFISFSIRGNVVLRYFCILSALVIPMNVPPGLIVKVESCYANGSFKALLIGCMGLYGLLTGLNRGTPGIPSAEYI